MECNCGLKSKRGATCFKPIFDLFTRVYKYKRGQEKSKMKNRISTRKRIENTETVSVDHYF